MISRMGPYVVLSVLLMTLFPTLVQPAITGLTLINAQTDLDIGPLGKIINLFDTGLQLNLRAEADRKYAAVEFELDGVLVKTETRVPYTIGGNNGNNNGNNYFVYPPLRQLGRHALVVRAKSKTGSVLTTYSANFDVVNRGVCELDDCC